MEGAMIGYVPDFLSVLEAVPREVWVGVGLTTLIILAIRAATKP